MGILYALEVMKWSIQSSHKWNNSQNYNFLPLKRLNTPLSGTNKPNQKLLIIQYYLGSAWISQQVSQEHC
jgi:hypothetical protein